MWIYHDEPSETILVFEFANKFSFTSGEYQFPLVRMDAQCLPLIARQGPDLMRLGIDFHQFRYPPLRKASTK
jgi:hypothetical protein